MLNKSRDSFDLRYGVAAYILHHFQRLTVYSPGDHAFPCHWQDILMSVAHPKLGCTMDAAGD